MIEKARKGLVRCIDASNTELAAEAAELVVPKLLGPGCLLLDLDLEEVKLTGTWAARFGEAAPSSAMVRKLRLPFCELKGPLPAHSAEQVSPLGNFTSSENPMNS